MAIPKKGSRIISVNESDYRWLIRRKATYSQVDYGLGKLHLAIESVENPGTSLFICTDRDHPHDIGAQDIKPVTPSDVANWIQQALKLGWRPSQKGIPFRTKVVNSILESE